MKVLSKHSKENDLAPETMPRTQRSRPFPKPEKSLNFGILTKGGPHENFWESFSFTKAKSDIFYVKGGVYDDGAIEK